MREIGTSARCQALLKMREKGRLTAALGLSPVEELWSPQRLPLTMPTRANSKVILHKLLYSGLITIRLASSSSQRPMTEESQEFVNAIANLLHNLPGDLEKASRKKDYDETLRTLWQRRRPAVEEWLRGNLAQNGVNPDTLN